MLFFIIEPEVAGGLGNETVIDRDKYPPKISKLHYEIVGWLGDDLLESFPAFIITDVARERILEERLSGVKFAEVKVTTTSDFQELNTQTYLPTFSWLKITGKPGIEDFGITADGQLCVSERTLDILEEFSIRNALVRPM